MRIYVALSFFRTLLVISQPPSHGDRLTEYRPAVPIEPASE